MIPRPNNARGPEEMSKHAPRLPTGRLPSGARSVSVSRRNVDDDDNMSVRSGRSSRSRVSRQPRGITVEDDDDDNFSRSSRTSRVSRAARGWDEDSAAGTETGSRVVPNARSTTVTRVARQPRGLVESGGNELGISEIKITSEDNPLSLSGESTVSEEMHSAGSEESEEHIEEDLPPGPLYDLWKDIENLYPVPIEAFDPKVIMENEKKRTAQRIAREKFIQGMKYFDPPKELQKLLAVIKSDGSDESYAIKKNKKGKSARAPLLPEKGAARRVNACGALRALSKNTKNRLRLGRTKGVISCLLHVMEDEFSTAEERARCSNTLMFLSVPKQNCDPIFHADPNILPILTLGMGDSDSRVRYNSCFTIFLLSKSEENRLEISNDSELIKTLVDIADIGIDDDADFDDDVSVDGSVSSQQFALHGSPSGIRQQGAPTTDEETKRGCRVSAIKVFLAISKAKDGAHKMSGNRSLMDVLTKISGTMTVEENILCMAIFANLTRNAENIDRLLRIPNFTESIARGLESRKEECRKCATLALQNLSCSKQFRRRIGASQNVLPGLARQALNNSDKKSADEAQLAAVHTMRNLAVEPSNMPALLGTPGLAASLICMASNKDKEMTQYVACDTLAALSQWLDAVSDTCIERGGIDLKGRNLASMKVHTWNQYT